MSPTRTRRLLPRRVAVALALLLALSLGALVPTAGAQEPPEPKPEGSTRIVGGSQAPAGAWPSQVGLLYRSISNSFQAQFCGGTAISRSWVLTAAHCVTDGFGQPLAASSFDVLAGTQSLSGGGTRIAVVEVKVISGFEPAPSWHRDVALLRLDRPTSVPMQAMAAQGSAVVGGTGAVTTGWGTLAYEEEQYPALLQQVGVTLRTDAQCRDGIPGGQSGYGADYRAASMVCAGQTGKDSCQGDSGGPLVVNQGGTWTQVGITSWGDGCGGDFPGVYTRVAAFRSWIDSQIRYGPFGDATSFVRQTYADLFRRSPSNNELFFAVVALSEGDTTPAVFVRDLVQGDVYQRETGGVTRLYSALFLRNPDTSGLTYWWDQVTGRRSLQRIANIMASTPEFKDRYGSLDEGQYVDLVYQNVLHRSPDAAGRAFWVGELSSGRRTRGEVMVGFSEGSEYRGENAARVDVIISFFGLVRRVPRNGELATWQSQGNLALDRSLLGSTTYAGRF